MKGEMIASQTSWRRSAILSLAVCLALVVGSATSAWSALIEFRYTGSGSTQDGTVNSLGGGHYSGVNIRINEVEISGAPANNGIFAVTGSLPSGFADLDFNTSTDTITLVGSILGMTGGTIGPTTLLSGSFNSFTFSNPAAGLFFFEADGPDTKDATLLTRTGLTGVPFQFANVQLGGNWNSGTGTGNPTTLAGVVNSTVPAPTSLLLFGTGLIGLVGIARREMLAKWFKG